MNDAGKTASTCRPARVAVVGGGLAGLAAATALASHGQQVTLFEARRHLGGRAASFRDPTTGRLTDLCQHIGMGCCTNLADFCARTGIADCFDRFGTLHFFPARGRPVAVHASRWLPAPLHLLPALLRLNDLSAKERIGILWTLARLARAPLGDGAEAPTIDGWLREHGQSQRSIERFWAAILVSAAGAPLQRISTAVARKVFVEAFMAARGGHELLIPNVPLRELYNARLAPRLARLGVRLHVGTRVKSLEGTAKQVVGLRLIDGRPQAADTVVLAVSWRHVAKLLPAHLAVEDLFASASPAPSAGQTNPEKHDEGTRRRAESAMRAAFQSSPITAVHLWFDRPITPLPHAVLIGRLGQWVFSRRQPSGTNNGNDNEHYSQVVISASGQISSWSRQEILDRVTEELRETWPAARHARRLRGYVVTDKDAVFSPLPGLNPFRPPQRTRMPGLAICGDWTATGWPATMEGAVRSGYLAAEAVLESRGRPVTVLVPDQPRGQLAKWFLGAPRDV